MTAGEPSPAPADAGHADAIAPSDPIESGADAAAVPYPDPDWMTGTPQSQGLDPSFLGQADAVAAANNSYCLLVIRHGVLVWESYFNGHDATSTDHSWSIAKSYSSAVTGIAIDRGDIGGLSDSVAKYVPAWKSKSNAAITVRDLVSMQSGLHWDVFGDYVTMAELAPDKTGYAVGLGIDGPPNAAWTYNNSAVQVLEQVVRSATGKAMDAYAQDHLWSPIGSKAKWDHDLAGHPTAYANVLATCRDHARLGYLYLHGGRWKSEQVVSSAWVKASTTPSQSMNQAYGYLWWINSGVPAMDAMNELWPGRMVANAPADLFAARGFGNQFIDVIPSLDMLVVRFGADPVNMFDLPTLIADSKFELHDKILAPILAGTH
jgi:CubicO group peptidase (beta-lactamase class C family)